MNKIPHHSRNLEVHRENPNNDRYKYYNSQQNMEYKKIPPDKNRSEYNIQKPHTYLVRTVLKHAKKHCDLCDKREIQIITKAPKGLEICQIVHSEKDEVGSNKSFVALCPCCKKKINSDNNKQILKKLRSKARKRIYEKPAITRKHKKQ